MDTVQKELLRKYWDGECSSEELTVVAALLKQPEATEVFHQLLIDRTSSEWTATSQERSIKLPLWKRQVYDRIKAAQGASSGQYRTKQRSMHIFRYAAVWIGVILVGSFLLWQFRSGDRLAFTVRQNLNGPPMRFVLPDSSTIYLAAGSTLRFPEKFNGRSREVELDGEAFFDITRNAARPFIIHSHDIQTRVLGTSFRVRSYDKSTLEVAVATGKVGVAQYADGKLMTELAHVTKGQRILWDEASGKLTHGDFDIHTLAQWKEGDLIWEEQKLADIASDLKRRYGVELILEDQAMADYRLSGSFMANQPVLKILKILSMAGNFGFEADGDKKIRIYKNEP